MNPRSALHAALAAAMILCGSGAAALAQEAALRIGQSLQLRVTGVPQEDQLALSGVCTIGDDGLIRLQWIEPIRAEGVKPSDLAKRIENAYMSAEIYTNPTVNVLPSDPQGTQYVSVLGEVKLPQNVVYRPGMSILDAIAACGSFTDFAKPKEVKLVRNGKVRVLDLRKVGDGATIKLMVGDTITVPD